MSMPVTVHLPSPLVPFAGGRKRVVLDGPRDVGEALRALPEGARDRVLDERGHVRPHVNVFVGPDNVKDTGGLSTRLAEGAELHVIAAVSGGGLSLLWDERPGPSPGPSGMLER
jgi:sulfur-carrier protein